MTSSFESYREAVQRGDHRRALKLLDEGFRDAKGRKDVSALEAVGAQASKLYPLLSGREQDECDRLLYSVNQNVAFLDRKARLAGRVLGPAPIPIEPELERGSEAPARDVAQAPVAEEDVPETSVGRLEHAWKRYAERAKQARADLKAAQSSHQSRLRAAQKHFAGVATTPKLAGSWLTPGELSKVAVYEDRIRLPEGEYPLTEDVQATVDTAGNLMVTRRHTLTRAALLGPFAQFAPKAVKHGENELYLLVEAEAWASVVKCDPKSGEAARKMSQAINLAARATSEAAAHRETLVAEARSRLHAVAADLTEIGDARRRLVQVKSDGHAALIRSYVDVQRELQHGDQDRAVKRAERRLAKIRDREEKLAGEIEAELERASAAAEIAPATDLEAEAVQADPAEDRKGRDQPPDAMPLPLETGRDGDPPAPAADPLVLLERLAALRDSGVLSAEEFEAKKAELLRRI